MNLYENNIKENILKVRENIRKAAERSGRTIDDITLIAVTKTVEPERIAAAIDEGITDLGENRVQELCSKFDKLGKPCNWHLIGHLQTNKVKYIIDKVKLIHSVDSLELAQEIQKRAKKADRIVDILVQVNVAQEETKFGIEAGETGKLVKEISTLPNIRVKGLMTIAPYAEKPEDVRYVFRKLKQIFDELASIKTDNVQMQYLSMGMSNDYEIAIEEGSNMVRIGTAIFGKRQYNNE